jgi:nicotinamidase-related amidase
MRDVLLVVDVLNDFEHEDGEALLAAFRTSQPALAAALTAARSAGVPVVYANDNHGVWDGDAPALTRRALTGQGGDLIRDIAPQTGDRFVVKPRYSAFDHTPLDPLLEELDAERILLAGTATEMCVAQTAIAAREHGLKVTVLTDACAAVNAENGQTALEYLERVVGVVLGQSGDVPGQPRSVYRAARPGASPAA